MENQFTKIFIEREEDSALVLTERGDILIRHAGALLRYRENIPAGLSQRHQRRPRKVLVGQEPHTALRGKTFSSRRSSPA